MAQASFFPERPNITPTIYVYELPSSTDHIGLLKIGYTDRDARTRILEQVGTAGLKPNILLEVSAMKSDGGSFTDHDIHRYLRKKGFSNPHGEWFSCKMSDIEAAIYAVRNGIKNEENRTLTFGMRPEQSAAVERTKHYFESYREENEGEIPHFLWNAKMRFGKTFTSYQLAKKMGWKKILVLTFKPAVESAWDEDLRTHVDFDGW